MAYPANQGELNQVYNNESAIIRSSFHSSQFSIQWTIDDFCDIRKSGTSFVESPKFFFYDNKSSWWLKVFPNYYASSNSSYNNRYNSGYYSGSSATGYVSVNVHTDISITNDVSIKLGLIDNQQKCSLNKILFFNAGSQVSCQNFVTRAELMNAQKGLLVNGSLTLHCEIKIQGKVSHFHSCRPKKKVLNTGNLPKDMKKLLDDSFLSDVAMTVTNANVQKVGKKKVPSKIEKKFKLHKAILGARSKVFADMFSCDLKEGTITNSISVTDIDVSVMKEVIQYIYTDTCSNLKRLVADILPVAEKYNLEGLKYMCGEELYSQLTMENALQTLTIAGTYNLVELKGNIINLISANAKTVIGSSSWKNLEKHHQQLASEVFKHIVEKQISDQS